jgi:hypothetical protein
MVKNIRLISIYSKMSKEQNLRLWQELRDLSITRKLGELNLKKRVTDFDSTEVLDKFLDDEGGLINTKQLVTELLEQIFDMFFLKIDESEAGVQMNVQAAESEAGVQMNVQAAESEAGVQMDVQAAESEAGVQMNVQAAESEDVVQIDVQAAESEDVVQMNVQAAESEAGVQMDVQAAESEAGVQMDVQAAGSKLWFPAMMKKRYLFTSDDTFNFSDIVDITKEEESELELEHHSSKNAISVTDALDIILRNLSGISGFFGRTFNSLLQANCFDLETVLSFLQEIAIFAELMITHPGFHDFPFIWKILQDLAIQQVTAFKLVMETEDKAHVEELLWLLVKVTDYQKDFLKQCIEETVDFKHLMASCAQSWNTMFILEEHFFLKLIERLHESKNEQKPTFPNSIEV